MLNQDAKEILHAALSIGEALADGVQLSDVGALMELPAAISGWKEGLDNLKETALSDPEEVSKFIAEDFDIPDDELEAKIEASIDWLSKTYQLYLLWKPEEEKD